LSYSTQNIVLQQITPSWLPDSILASVLRLDMLHPEVSGNKWFKLKLNLKAAEEEGKSHIVTFGGAYSNHIAATAAACQIAGLRCTGIIRGERAPVLSHTLEEAAAKGMELVFISREEYGRKEEIDWGLRYPDAYIVPEGGNNAYGAKGCEYILMIANEQFYEHTAIRLSTATNGERMAFTHIACAVGTGTTLAGIINSATSAQEVRGYAVLKGAAYLEQEIHQLLKTPPLPHWELLHEHYEGGYGKVTAALKTFILEFYKETQIPLDVVYTGKLLMGFKKDVEEGKYPPGSHVLLIHTGGLQGNPRELNDIIRP